MSKSKAPLIFLFIIAIIALIIAIDANEDAKKVTQDAKDLWVEVKQMQVNEIIEKATRFDWTTNTEFLHFMDDNFNTEFTEGLD